ncbi:MAG: penicillin-binding transpeptidase domain-containing protein [Verrucomicrobiales bacterium]
MSLRNLLLSFIPAILLAGGGTLAVHADEFTVPVDSTDEYRHFLAKIPAPRGLIVDRTGKPLAYSKTGKRLTVRLLTLADRSGETELAEAVEDLCEELRTVCPSVSTPDPESIERHFEHRPYLPFPVSRLLPDAELKALSGFGEDHFPAVEIQTVITRVYPREQLASHLVGFVGRKAPDQHGPYGRNEYRWPPLQGRYGLEKSFDDELRGTDGLVSLLYDREGKEVNREILKAPVPGKTIVTSVNLDMQELAMAQLEESEHNGAFVAVDAETGDILALASYPGFDPNEFVSSLSLARYVELGNQDGSPFFDRAVSGAYPPGSTFKPFVALAALSSGAISEHTKFSGPPSMWINEHEFKNWNDKHEGSFGVRYALLRSCNTWFYQAAMQTKQDPLLLAAHRFRFGTAPDIPLGKVSAGHVDESLPSNGRLANAAIGQGRLMASPLQMALAMTGFANRDRIALPRLVLQIQDPLSGEIEQAFPERSEPLGYDEEAVDIVREGMWGVVNYARGTGQRAKLEKPRVFGKTGTAQWPSRGKDLRAAWFSGFVDANSPKIAFAAVTEGAEDETMSGGRNSAPLAGEFLRSVYEEPDEFYVSVPDEPLTPEPSFAAPRGGQYAASQSEPGSQARSRSSRDGRTIVGRDRHPRAEPRPQPRRKRGFFARLFGGSN